MKKQPRLPKKPISDRQVVHPELVDDQEWTVGDAPHSRLDFSKREMAVPGGESSKERAERLRRMAEVAISVKPEDQVLKEALQSVQPETFEAAERARIHQWLASQPATKQAWYESGHAELTAEDQDRIKQETSQHLKAFEQGDGLQLARYLLSTLNSAAANVAHGAVMDLSRGNQELRSKFMNEVFKALGKVRTFLRDNSEKGPETSLAVARYLESIFSTEDSPDDAYSEMVEKGASTMVGDEEMPSVEEFIEAEAEAEASGESDEPSEGDGESGEFGPDGSDDGKGYSEEDWTPMVIEEPPRPFAVTKAKVSKKYKARLEGAVPSRMHRLMTDGRVFAKKLRHYGGSMLFDLSGSMHLSLPEILAVIDVAPQTIVAGYAGDDYLEGVLRILVKEGRKVADDDLTIPYSGNSVDAPALEWLGKQEFPRLWISDGEVGSYRNNMGYSTKARRVCADICRRHGIIRVDTAEAALEVFRMMRPKR